MKQRFAMLFLCVFIFSIFSVGPVSFGDSWRKEVTSYIKHVVHKGGAVTTHLVRRRTKWGYHITEGPHQHHTVFAFRSAGEDNCGNTSDMCMVCE